MLFKRIKDLATSITTFRTGDVIPVDGPSGTAKMSKDDLLRMAAENALAGNVAQAFDPTHTSENPYKEGESVSYEGKVYTFKVDHYGAWAAADVYIPNRESPKLKVSFSKTKAFYLYHEESAIVGGGLSFAAGYISSGVIDVNEGDYFECDPTYRWHAIWYFDGSWNYSKGTGLVVPSGSTKVFIIYKSPLEDIGMGLECILWMVPAHKKIISNSIEGAPKISFPNYVMTKVADLYHERSAIDQRTQRFYYDENDATRTSSGVIDVNEGDYFECDPTYRWHAIWYFDGSWNYSYNTSYVVPSGVTKVLLSYGFSDVANIGTGINCLVRYVKSRLNVLGRYFPKENFVPFSCFKASDVHWENSQIIDNEIVYSYSSDRITSGPIKVSEGDYLCCDENFPWHSIWYFKTSTNSWTWNGLNTTRYAVPNDVSYVYIVYTSGLDNRGVGLDTIIYCYANITGISNPLWNQLENDKLSFGLNRAGSPIPYPKYISEFIHGMLLIKNMGYDLNRWGFHLIEGWNLAGDSRFTALLDKHNSDVNGKPSFEMYFFIGSNHKASSYGNVRIGSDVQNHSFVFDRDTLTAFGQVDLKSVITCARISPSNDLITCADVSTADSTYEPENSSIDNAKCLLYLALHNAQNGALFYDTDRDSLVAKIDGKWCDLSFTDASSNYNF